MNPFGSNLRICRLEYLTYLLIWTFTIRSFFYVRTYAADEDIVAFADGCYAVRLLPIPVGESDQLHANELC